MRLVKENKNGTHESITIKINKERDNKPLDGINLAIVGTTHKYELIVNTVLTYEDVLYIYSQMTKYITEVQQALIS